jgi:D-tyrosyl-tRNA(Tyr) deacylase
MRAVVQRVTRAKVTVQDEITGQIGNGLLILLGVSQNDSEKDVFYLVEKSLGLRIFDDSEGKMNLSIVDTGGEILAVSQFTLYGDTRRGRRPSFIEAAPPERANELYELFVSEARKTVKVETGRFQAMMQVELVNDGPVTILLDSTKLF